MPTMWVPLCSKPFLLCYKGLCLEAFFYGCLGKNRVALGMVSDGELEGRTGWVETDKERYRSFPCGGASIKKKEASHNECLFVSFPNGLSFKPGSNRRPFHYE